MFSYIILEDGPKVQVLYGDNIIDESGPWESLTAAVNWADAYVGMKNSGIQEPVQEQNKQRLREETPDGSHRFS